MSFIFLIGSDLCSITTSVSTYSVAGRSIDELTVCDFAIAPTFIKDLLRLKSSLITFAKITPPRLYFKQIF